MFQSFIVFFFSKYIQVYVIKIKHPYILIYVQRKAIKFFKTLWLFDLYMCNFVDDQRPHIIHSGCRYKLMCGLLFYENTDMWTHSALSYIRRIYIYIYVCVCVGERGELFLSYNIYRQLGPCKVKGILLACSLFRDATVKGDVQYIRDMDLVFCITITDLLLVWIIWLNVYFNN